MNSVIFTWHFCDVYSMYSTLMKRKNQWIDFWKKVKKFLPLKAPPWIKSRFKVFNSKNSPPNSRPILWFLEVRLTLFGGSFRRRYKALRAKNDGNGTIFRKQLPLAPPTELAENASKNHKIGGLSPRKRPGDALGQNLLKITVILSLHARLTLKFQNK